MSMTRAFKEQEGDRNSWPWLPMRKPCQVYFSEITSPEGRGNPGGSTPVPGSPTTWVPPVAL